jgi:hypothetical protein
MNSSLVSLDDISINLLNSIFSFSISSFDRLLL